MITKRPKRINPALSDRLSPEKLQALVDAGYVYLLELIDLLNETMWERVQEDGWTKANDRLLEWLIDRIKLLPEWEGRQLLHELDSWGDCPYDKKVTVTENYLGWGKHPQKELKT